MKNKVYILIDKFPNISNDFILSIMEKISFIIEFSKQYKNLYK